MRAVRKVTERVYITPEGARRLRDELNHIWKTQRPEVTRRVAAAAALGDRSENADYTYGKKQLRELDKRIRYLSKTLDKLAVVDRKPDDLERVYFGAWVTLEDEAGDSLALRIVGVDEFDPKRNWISINSPVARQILGKRLGDETVLERPDGPATMSIEAISYEPPDG